MSEEVLNFHELDVPKKDIKKIKRRNKYRNSTGVNLFYYRNGDDPPTISLIKKNLERWINSKAKNNCSFYVDKLNSYVILRIEFREKKDAFKFKMEAQETLNSN